MEDINKIVHNLNTFELQILGSLHKINSGQKRQGEMDLESIAKKIKASCKSLTIKIDRAAEENENLKKQNELLKEKVMKLEVENKQMCDEKSKTIKELQEELQITQASISWLDEDFAESDHESPAKRNKVTEEEGKNKSKEHNKDEDNTKIEHPISQDLFEKETEKKE